MKKISNIFTIVLVLLTSLVFGQVTQFPVPFSGGSNSTQFSASQSSISSNTFSPISSSSQYTLTFDYSQSFGSRVSIIVNSITVKTFTVGVGNGTLSPQTFTSSAAIGQITFQYTNAITNVTNIILTYNENETITGINNVSKADLPLDMYSNLTTIFVKNNENIEGVKLEVFNLAGQLVFEEEKVTKNEYELNVSTGIYIVRLSKNDSFKVKKVFIGQ